MKVHKCFVYSMICIILLCACSKASNPQNNQNEGVFKVVWERIQPEVVKGLKNPESAEFGEYTEAIIEQKGNIINIIGQVYASNSYGTQIPNTFEINVTMNGMEIEKIGNVNFFNNTSFATKKKAAEQKLQREDRGEKLLSVDELGKEMQKQDLYVYKTNITKKEEMLTASGDMLHAILYNNSKNEILSATIAFVCWDENGLPLKIQSPSKMSDGDYLLLVEYNNINLVSGKTYGTDKGYYIDESLNVYTVKAIVVSFQTVNGDEWQNPYLVDFIELYEKKKLE